VVEDFEIRKPLILPDAASSVQIEVSYDVNERTFAIQTRFDESAAWSLHVVGSMRGERTESVFADTTWDSPTRDTEPVELQEFYRYMSDPGPALWRRIPTHSRTLRRQSHSAVAWHYLRSSPHALVNTRCIRCSSTARSKHSLREPRPSKIAVRV
jgi:hypothetical protein